MIVKHSVGNITGIYKDIKEAKEIIEAPKEEKEVEESEIEEEKTEEDNK